MGRMKPCAWIAMLMLYACGDDPDGSPTSTAASSTTDQTDGETSVGETVGDETVGGTTRGETTLGETTVGAESDTDDDGAIVEACGLPQPCGEAMWQCYVPDPQGCADTP